MANRSRQSLCCAVTCYAVSSLAIVLGASFGLSFVRRAPYAASLSTTVPAALTGIDGRWYEAILTEGYGYDPEQPSNVAFFPIYPILARLIAWTGVPPRWALLGVAHLSFFLSCWLLVEYVGFTRPDATDLSGRSALVLALAPTSVFFGLGYSESTFLLLSLAAMYALARNWPLPLCALVTGVASATRPVGVALLAPLIWCSWQHGTSVKARLLRVVWLVPLGCWGLLAYSGYQWWTFDEPLAFAKTQSQFSLQPPLTPFDKAKNLASLRPLMAPYETDAPTFWRDRDGHDLAWLSLQFLNPILFVLAVSGLVWGATRKILSVEETALAAFLLLIPYLTRGYERGMGSMGRFTAVAFPLYIVWGHGLRRLPRPWAELVFAVSAALLAALGTMFAAGYWIN